MRVVNDNGTTHFQADGLQTDSLENTDQHNGQQRENLETETEGNLGDSSNLQGNNSGRAQAKN